MSDSDQRSLHRMTYKQIFQGIYPSFEEYYKILVECTTDHSSFFLKPLNIEAKTSSQMSYSEDIRKRVALASENDMEKQFLEAFANVIDAIYECRGVYVRLGTKTASTVVNALHHVENIINPLMDYSHLQSNPDRQAWYIYCTTWIQLSDKNDNALDGLGIHQSKTLMCCTNLSKLVIKKHKVGSRIYQPLESASRQATAILEGYKTMLYCIKTMYVKWKAGQDIEHLPNPTVSS